MDPFIPIGLGVGAAVFGLVNGISWWLDSRRREVLEAWAKERGWTFAPAPSDWPAPVAGFRLFTQAHGHRYLHECRGSRDGLEVRLADVRYTTGRGRNARTWNVTVAMALTPGSALPRAYLRRQVAVIDAMGKLLGGQDLDVPEDPTFSKTFVLQAVDDPEATRRLMNPGARELLLRITDGHLQVETGGAAVLLHRSRRLDPEDLDGLVADVVNLRRHWS